MIGEADGLVVVGAKDAYEKKEKGTSAREICGGSLALINSLQHSILREF